MIISNIDYNPLNGFSYIYVLLDPRGNNVKYIGKSVNPKERYRKHLTAKGNTYKHKWVNLLTSKNLKPIMKIVDICNDNFVDIYERKWIEIFRQKGINITNILDGGDGGATMLGKKLTKEQRRKISIANKGNKQPRLIEYNKINKSKKVQQIDFETKEVINTYNSCIEAAKSLNKNSGSFISQFASGKTKSTIKKVYGYIWKYV